MVPAAPFPPCESVTSEVHCSPFQVLSGVLFRARTERLYTDLWKREDVFVSDQADSTWCSPSPRLFQSLLHPSLWLKAAQLKLRDFAHRTRAAMIPNLPSILRTV